MQGYRTRKITKILPEAIHSAKSPKHARNLGRRNGRLVLPEATARRTSQRKAFLHDATNLRAGHGQVFATLSMEHALPSQQDDLEPDAGVQAPRSSCQRFKRRLLCPYCTGQATSSANSQFFSGSYECFAYTQRGFARLVTCGVRVPAADSAHPQLVAELVDVTCCLRPFHVN